MRATSHTQTLRGNQVLLRAGTLRLLVPQEDLGAAEYVAEPPRPTATRGLFESASADAASGRWVVAPSQRLRPLAQFPADRFLLTRLADDERDLSLAWHEVRVLIDATLERHALPPVMRAPDAPIDGYVVVDGEVALCSRAARIAAHMLRGHAQ